MPRIFDNIRLKLSPALQQTMTKAYRADFCVGYFHLRGWRELAPHVELLAGGEEHCCRLIVGMQDRPQDEVRAAMSLTRAEADDLDNQTALRLKKKLAEDFRQQLTYGVPNNADETALRTLVAQIKTGKVVVKLFLRHRLHAKLYLLFRHDDDNPMIGYLGSSNLTFSGLSSQGELNVDVLDHDACEKLAQWFKDRWDDRWCVDISKELVDIIEESWAREDLIPPYHIYVKMAYHLSQEARDGLLQFRIPREFGNKLFEFQKAAVKIAAHHLNTRRGVLIGDVVGLGKTLMATALARVFEDDQGLETLIICPKNLVKMWEDYRDQYRMHAKVMSISRVINDLPDLRRYRLVLIDESHNLRNREGKRYRAIQDYVQKNESRVILLTATPYNKTYLDLSNQLRLFVPEDADIGIRPERLLGELGETEFIRRHQCSLRSLAAFEKSEYTDDWRELMRLYMVRRTRSFIRDNYAETDPATDKKYLTFEDGRRSYFPKRKPKTVKFKIDDQDPNDQYARLYAPDVVDIISNLNLPRYGLGNYVLDKAEVAPTAAEKKVLEDLSRAGKRLMGFCRVGLFKRLESSGLAFLLSVERHILRNMIVLHALEQDLPVPIGTQDSAMLDSRLYDGDADSAIGTLGLFDDDEENGAATTPDSNTLRTEADFRRLATEVYNTYAGQYKSRFRWLRSGLFNKRLLVRALREDVTAMLRVLAKCRDWDPAQDAKLAALQKLLTKKHANDKVLIFTQFADTVSYLERELTRRGVTQLSGVTGASPDPTELAWRFSPVSNEKRDRVLPIDELRVLIATDVLSEGQNLQDSFVVVNYDLPWAIIRLIQRAGRVDRIGQEADQIYSYSFLPADGVERLLRLRARVRQRLRENAEVVGTDEAFFEDDQNDRAVVDLYHEKAGILDNDEDAEVDLASYAYQIWKNAITAEPGLQKVIPDMPPVVFSARSHEPTDKEPNGVLVYLRTAEGNDALARVDEAGNSVTESQYTILKVAECAPDTPALPRTEQHHELVQRGAELIIRDEKAIGGALGRPSGARFKTYERLMRYAEAVKGTLWDTQELRRAIEDIYRYPLRSSAVDTLNRQLRMGIEDDALAQLVIALRSEDRLCIVDEEEQQLQEPRIICSLGLRTE
jgi:superfamily II DNA or RNA helicase